jgi:hypothetical protein
MAYTVPTVTDLKTRFPEFADDADEDISPFITASQLYVDTSQWTETDYFYGIIYLAAHFYTMYKQASLAAAGSGGGNVSADGPVSSFASQVRFEDFSVQFLQDARQKSASLQFGGSSAGKDLLQTTAYGLLFEQLRDMNIVPFALLT